MKKYIIACAGAGKTTLLIDEAIKRFENETVLITTFTDANDQSIKNKLIKKLGYVPQNIKIKTWFSFLIENGVKPYKNDLNSSMDSYEIKGLNFESAISNYRTGRYGNTYSVGENDFFTYYFTKTHKIHSDKLAQLVLKCNEKSNGAVFSRIKKIFDNIFIDEVQDLSGYDLEIIKELLKLDLNVLLVGDPRQATYRTAPSRKNEKYNNGKLRLFLEDNNITNCEIDETTLQNSWRCSQDVCDLVSKVYENYPKVLSHKNETEQTIFVIEKNNINEFIKKYTFMQLRYRRDEKTIIANIPVTNMGESKGLEFDNTIVYLTKNMTTWLENQNIVLPEETKAKLYVALTRSKGLILLIKKK